MKKSQSTKIDDGLVYDRQGRWLRIREILPDGRLSCTQLRTAKFTTDHIALTQLQWDKLGVRLFLHDTNMQTMLTESDLAGKLILSGGNIGTEIPREWINYIVN